MKKRSYSQLEKHYNRIDRQNGNEEQSLYERVLEDWWGSSSPQDTIKNYFSELNREGRRQLLGQFATRLQSGLFITMLEQLEIIETEE